MADFAILGYTFDMSPLSLCDLVTWPTRFDLAKLATSRIFNLLYRNGIKMDSHFPPIQGLPTSTVIYPLRERKMSAIKIYPQWSLWF